MFTSPGTRVPQKHERRSCHEPGNYRRHHWCAGHHHLGDRHSSAHLTADPRAGKGADFRRPWAAFPPQACTSAPRSLSLCFAAFGVLRCQVLVGGREILTAQAGPVQKLEKFSYVCQQSRRGARPPGLLSCDVERR